MNLSIFHFVGFRWVGGWHASWVRRRLSKGIVSCERAGRQCVCLVWSGWRRSGRDSASDMRASGRTPTPIQFTAAADEWNFAETWPWMGRFRGLVYTCMTLLDCRHGSTVVWCNVYVWHQAIVLDYVHSVISRHVCISANIKAFCLDSNVEPGRCSTYQWYHLRSTRYFCQN